MVRLCFGGRVREAVGREFIVVYRLSMLDLVEDGSTLDEVKATIGWELKVPADVPETPAPTDEELRLIREELDPSGAYV